MSLNETDESNLINHIAPIVYMDDTDEYAKRFDNLMYEIMLALIGQMPQLKKGKKQLINISHALQKKMTIPQVKEKAELIKMVSEDTFWQAPDVLALEEVRLALRSLIRLIIDDGGKDPIYTNLLDIVIDVQEGANMPQGDDLIEYKTKVDRYIEEHKDHISIAKLRNNIPLTDTDYKSLENILTGELGSAEDYKREFGDTPFGLLVRKIAKLEQEAALLAFSEFISDQSLDQYQVVFVKKIIDFIVQNGYVESTSELLKPPFDKPQNFMKLFDSEKQQRLVQIIETIKNNALKTAS